MKTTHIIALVGLAVFVVILGLNLSESASIYTDFQTAKLEEKPVHIVGTWVQREAANYDERQDLFRFYLQDTTAHTELVHYYDPKPINFETAEKVVVIGEYRQQGFVADKIIMKCPSKYEPESITSK